MQKTETSPIPSVGRRKDLINANFGGKKIATICQQMRAQRTMNSNKNSHISRIIGLWPHGVQICAVWRKLFAIAVHQSSGGWWRVNLSLRPFVYPSAADGKSLSGSHLGSPSGRLGCLCCCPENLELLSAAQCYMGCERCRSACCTAASYQMSNARSKFSGHKVAMSWERQQERKLSPHPATHSMHSMLHKIVRHFRAIWPGHLLTSLSL